MSQFQPAARSRIARNRPSDPPGHQASPQPGLTSDRTSILTLQRSVGNRVVSRMLAGSGGAIQRQGPDDLPPSGAGVNTPTVPAPNPTGPTEIPTEYPPGFLQDPSFPGPPKVPNIPEPPPGGFPNPPPTPANPGAGAAGTGAAEAGAAEAGAGAGAAEAGAVAEGAGVVGLGAASAAVGLGLAAGMFGPLAIGYGIQHANELNQQTDPDERSLPGGAPPQQTTDENGDAGAPPPAPTDQNPAPNQDDQ